MKVNAAMTFTTPRTSGIVTYAWAAGDTDTSGRYLCEVSVTWGDTTTTTFPDEGYDLVLISDDLA